MKSLTFVEIDVDYCSLTYGTAPCTASLGVTGTDRCFNTLNTCQARAAFTNVPVTLRFAIDTLGLAESGIEALPYLVSVNYQPQTISLGQDLGTRASITATFMDRPHADTGAGFDKYVSLRSYNPFTQGTFFGKFAVRQKFLKGRPMRLITGYVGQNISEMETRHFLIESFSGPDRNGAYSITAKDALKLADADRAQAPVLSLGYLSSNITNVATSATLLPVGVGSTYPASGYVNIGGKEICAFTRSGDVLTLTRAQFNTTAQAHNSEDRVQLCIYYNGISPELVIQDLLVNYADVPASYITIADWTDEIGNYYRRQITAMITDTTSVKKLVSEIIEQVGLAIWWDDEAQQIRLQVLRQFPITDGAYDDGNILEGSLNIKEQPEKRLSQVWNYYGQINPLKDVEDIDNYRSTLATVDPQSQSDYGQPAIKKIYARWIPALAQTVASRINNIQLGRFVNPPRKVSFSIFRTYDGSITIPKLGSVYSVSTKSLQDQYGAPQTVTFQVTRLTPYPDRIEVEAEENTYTILSTDDLNIKTLTVSSDITNINLRESHDQVFPDPEIGDELSLIIQTGAKMGASSASLPALTIGSWPTVTLTVTRTSGSPTLTVTSGSLTGLKANMRISGTGIPSGAIITNIVGSTITMSANATSSGSASLTVAAVIIRVVLRGSIYGAGGLGGNGGNFNGVASSGNKNGNPGGTGLYTRYMINLEFSAGQRIAGGGGGGGGGGCEDFDDHRGGGGGGGAGFIAGSGGQIDGAGENGLPGTLTTGGAGGRSYATNGFLGQLPGPSLNNGYNGGKGGNLGSVGTAGDTASNFSIGRGTGGAAGTAVDGISYIKVTSGTATYTGPTTN